MIGAKEFVGGVNSLQFRIGKNKKGVTTIVVKLTDNDDYTVEAWRIWGHDAATVRKLDERTGVWAAELKNAIATLTELEVNL